MRKPYQLTGWTKNSSYYSAPVGDRTHDLPHLHSFIVAKVSHALNHSAMEAEYKQRTFNATTNLLKSWRGLLVKADML